MVSAWTVGEQSKITGVDTMRKVTIDELCSQWWQIDADVYKRVCREDDWDLLLSSMGIEIVEEDCGKDVHVSDVDKDTYKAYNLISITFDRGDF